MTDPNEVEALPPALHAPIVQQIPSSDLPHIMVTEVKNIKFREAQKIRNNEIPENQN